MNTNNSGFEIPKSAIVLCLLLATIILFRAVYGSAKEFKDFQTRQASSRESVIKNQQAYSLSERAHSATGLVTAIFKVQDLPGLSYAIVYVDRAQPFTGALIKSGTVSIGTPVRIAHTYTGDGDSNSLAFSIAEPLPIELEK